MVEKRVVIKNRLGLHARAAVKFVNLANRFSSNVKIIKDTMEIDGKSILGILTLAASQGTSVVLRVAGEDENEAIKALVDLINRKFEEKE